MYSSITAIVSRPDLQSRTNTMIPLLSFVITDLMLTRHHFLFFSSHQQNIVSFSRYATGVFIGVIGTN